MEKSLIVVIVRSIIIAIHGKAVKVIGHSYDWFDVWNRPTWNIQFVQQQTTENTLNELDCSQSTIQVCSIEYNLRIEHVNCEDIVRVIVIIILEANSCRNLCYWLWSLTKRATQELWHRFISLLLCLQLPYTFLGNWFLDRLLVAWDNLMAFEWNLLVKETEKYNLI